ncbi:MAG: hypothetical protein BGO29_07760 [Bacteroidales bacterium 36-12]|jgi:3-methyladenine DNA glycosylase AlkD|nr:MAG: hypothetical protein BGO29_07760 [Bacteroidales bacterium 36-12]
MKYILSDPTLDLQISKIRRQIVLSMNGEVSASMKNHGIVYAKNYGVSIIRLREIAKTTDKNHDVAQRLWMTNIRETLIMATLLQPEQTFTKELALQWQSKCDNIELIEQACINLYQHLDYASEICLQFISSDDIKQKTFGFTLALWIYDKLTFEDIITITEEIITSQLSLDDVVLMNKIAQSCAKFTRKDEETAMYIFESFKVYADSELSSLKHIYQTISQELIFLGYITDDV